MTGPPLYSYLLHIYCKWSIQEKRAVPYLIFVLKAEPREHTYHIFNTARMTSRYVAFTMAGPDKC